MISKDLLAILRCPTCRGTLSYEEEKMILVCGKCNNVYCIQNNVPVMLVNAQTKGS